MKISSQSTRYANILYYIHVFYKSRYVSYYYHHHRHHHHDLNNRYPCYFFISCAEYLQKWIIDGWVSGCCWCCRYCWCRNVGVAAEIERNLKDSFDLLPTSIDSTFCVWGRPSREASDYKCNKFMYTYTLVWYTYVHVQYIKDEDSEL